MLTQKQKTELIAAFLDRGYNPIDAKNEANGPNAERYYAEYCTKDLMKMFTDLNNEKPIDIDGFPKDNPFQCMDAMRAYCRDVLKFGAYVLPKTDYAYQVFKNFPDAGNKYFEKVYNNPKDLSQLPPRGSLLFWKPFAGFGTITGIAGHVALIEVASSYKIKSWDQNWPKKTFFHLQEHSYTGVWGWLIPKKT